MKRLIGTSNGIEVYTDDVVTVTPPSRGDLASWRGKPLPDDPDALKAIIQDMAAYYEERIAAYQARELHDLDVHFGKAKARLLDPRKRSLIGLVVDAVRGVK